ncbi:MAG TPA: NAD(P)-dependent oxidoreductase [Rhizomicrobium sp.]|jgi:nucleoside-diphosphate-sugar epimerase|nr:NAD(P)-dependent oxidoreductase [Rhizomicrobium sp.]
MDGNILITGGAGFIGKALCQRLGRAGWTVHATSRSPRSEPGIRWICSALDGPEEARRVVDASRPDAIFHLAGAVGAGAERALVRPAFRSLLASTIDLLDVALDAGCARIVLAGSFTEPRGGADWPVPGSPYAAAKWAGSGYGRMYHALYGAPVAILRPFMVYGPGQAASKIVPSVIGKLLDGEAAPLSSGRARADWVYIDDVAEAFAAAATADGIDGRTIDLGTGELHSVREVAETLCGVVGGAARLALGALPDRPAEVEVAADIGPAQRLLGWRARTPLREGLTATVERMRAARKRGLKTE